MIEEFLLSQHYDLMSSWYEERGIPPVSLNSLPRTGFIANRMAAGFLIQTNTDVCIFDYLASDPKAKQIERTRSVIEVVASLLSAGRQLGYKRVNILTGLSGVKAMAKRFGLRVSPRVVFMEGDL